MWEKIKSAFSWTWKQIKEHPYLVVALSSIGGPVLGALLGWIGKKMSLVASSLRSPSTSATHPSRVNILPADSSSTSQPSTSPSLLQKVERCEAQAPLASASSNLELEQSNSPATLNAVSLFKNSPGSIPTLKDMILNHVGIDALIEQSKGNQILFEIAKPTLVSHLLQLVAFGKQDEAEALLKNHPSLVLGYGEVSDNAGRTFENITAFQYALWAKDRHMWRMLLKYLPNFDAAEQLKEHENVDEATKPDYVKAHGNYFSFEELKNALSGYINHMSAFDTPTFNWDEAERIWTKEVGLDGGAQSRVPVHVVNEYCHPNRSFNNPRESFRSDLNLPRIVNFFNWVTDTWHSWFRELSAGSSVSYSVGVYRGENGGRPAHGWGRDAGMWGVRTTGAVADIDLAAINALDEVRTREINALKAELIPTHVASLSTVPR